MNEQTLAKTYDPKSIEANWYDTWLESGHFACAPNSTATPYAIMMPPPNVTGSLHMGHALTFTLQDLLIRYHRMAGRDVLWQPGTDHAGIATQMVVERELANKGLPSRQELGREKFLEKVWEWKNVSGNTIIERYIDRQREEAEAELRYSKTIKLEGFKPWDTWVPMPYPHRELNFARKMYMRGDNLLVQSPDFWEFPNDIKNVTNKN